MSFLTEKTLPYHLGNDPRQDTSIFGPEADRGIGVWLSRRLASGVSEVRGTRAQKDRGRPAPGRPPSRTIYTHGVRALTPTRNLPKAAAQSVHNRQGCRRMVAPPSER
jgi:hypothetical protein